MLVLATITGSFLLLFAALYFGLEAMRSQSKVVNAYILGRADALEEVLKGYQKNASNQPSAKEPQIDESDKVKPLND